MGGACSHGLGVLNHGDIPPPDMQNLLTEVDYCSILPQERNSQYVLKSHVHLARSVARVHTSRGNFDPYIV